MSEQERLEAELAALEAGRESVIFAGKSPDRVAAYDAEIARVKAALPAPAPAVETAAVEVPEKAVAPRGRARKPA